MTGPTTPVIESPVWALPTSLAATMGISYRFLFLCLLRCVTSAGLAFITYVFSYEWQDIILVGFPHSDSSGSKLYSSSPKLFAGFRVLLRLLMPRHPPTALSSLITKFLWRCLHLLLYIFVWSHSPQALFFICELFFPLKNRIHDFYTIYTLEVSFFLSRLSR